MLVTAKLLSVQFSRVLLELGGENSHEFKENILRGRWVVRIHLRGLDVKVSTSLSIPTIKIPSFMKW